MKRTVTKFINEMGQNFRSIDVLLLLSFGAMLVIRIIANYSSWSISSSGSAGSILLPLIGYSFLSITVICLVASLNEKQIYTISVIICILLVIWLVFVLGQPKSKGAARWTKFGDSWSFQPSELIKPFLIFVNANLIYQSVKLGRGHLIWVSFSLVILVFFLVYLEPDLGGSLQILVQWFFLLFLIGLPYVVLLLVGGLLAGVIVLASLTLSHVSKRVDSFFSSIFDGTTVNHQVENATRAIANGGLVGKGPGEGVSKNFVPEAKSDFIYAIISEEFGLLFGFSLLAIYCFILLRTYLLLQRDRNLLTIIAGSGMVFMITLQMLINLSSVLNLIPTKGLTLPFISAGGTSLLTVSITAGMLLSLTRKKYRSEFSDNAT